MAAAVDAEHEKVAALRLVASTILLETAAEASSAQIVVPLADIARYLKDMSSEELAATLGAWAG